MCCAIGTAPMSPGPNSCPVLCSCAPAEHALAHEGEGEGEGGECSVEFRDWPALLWAVHHAVLAAWRPVLSNALLLQLEQLEGTTGAMEAAAAAAATSGDLAAGLRLQEEDAAGTAATLEGRGSAFLERLLGEQAPPTVSSLLLRAGSIVGGEGGGGGGCSSSKLDQLQIESAAQGASKPTGRSSGCSSGRLQRHSSGSGRQQAGSKHTLASRLVRYSGPAAIGSQPTVTVPQEAPWGGAATVTAERQRVQQRAASLQWQAGADGSSSSVVLARLHPHQWPGQLGHQQPQQRDPQGAKPAAASNAVQTAPGFLQAGAGVDVLLSSWHHHSAGGGVAVGSASGNGSGILSLDTLTRSAFTQLKPAALTRQQLLESRALQQQVDFKFIPIVSGSLLSLMDQHAAGEDDPPGLMCFEGLSMTAGQHVNELACLLSSLPPARLPDNTDERVQLERLRDQLLGPEGRPRAAVALSQALRTPLPLSLTDGEQQLLEAFQHKLRGWGWQWWRCAGSSSSNGGTLLTHVPLLWGTELTATDLKVC